MARRKLIIILGPTAVGKTAYSIAQARRYGSPVISCDSRQLYREMRIGTAVPSAEELSAVRHYFIQTVPVTRAYTAWQYAEDALALISRLFAEGHDTLVMTGGSMLYIDAVCRGLDPVPQAPPELRAALASRLAEEGVGTLAEELRALDPVTYGELDLSNPRRVLRALEVCLATGRPFSSFKTRTAQERDFVIEKVGLMRPREELYRRIDRRVLGMMEEGLLDEVRSLLPYRDLPALQTVGYRELFDCLDGLCTLDEAVALIQQHSRNYAKRQLTWWRRDSSIVWTDFA